MKNQTYSYTESELSTIAQMLAKKLPSHPVMTFTGMLGAGKTTLIRAMLHTLGVKEPITSPTFTYVNVYLTAEGITIYHFDLYRIHTLEEFLAAGFEEYLYAPQSYALIEWPAPIMPLLDHAVCHVSIDYQDQLESRLLSFDCIK